MSFLLQLIWTAGLFWGGGSSSLCCILETTSRQLAGTSVPVPREVLLQGFRGNGNELEESVKQFPLNGTGRIGKLLSGVQFSTHQRKREVGVIQVVRCF